MNKDSLFEFHNLIKRYDYNSSLEIRVKESEPAKIIRGKFNFILGPSGSGKSTLLYLLSLLNSPDKSKSELFYKSSVNGPIDDILAYSEENKNELRLNDFGFVFQRSHELKNFSVLYNIALPLLLQGFPKKDAMDKALDLLRYCSMEKLADGRAGQLSGGQLTRLSLLRGVISDPKVLFVDEPTNNLDPASAENVISLLDTWKKGDEDRTVVMVTHDVDIAINYGNHFLILNKKYKSNNGYLHSQLSAEFLSSSPSQDPKVKPDLQKTAEGNSISEMPKEDFKGFLYEIYYGQSKKKLSPINWAVLDAPKKQKQWPFAFWFALRDLFSQIKQSGLNLGILFVLFLSFYVFGHFYFQNKVILKLKGEEPFLTQLQVTSGNKSEFDKNSIKEFKKFRWRKQNGFSKQNVIFPNQSSVGKELKGESFISSSGFRQFKLIFGKFNKRIKKANVKKEESPRIKEIGYWGKSFLPDSKVLKKIKIIHPLSFTKNDINENSRGIIVSLEMLKELKYVEDLYSISTDVLEKLKDKLPKSFLDQLALKNFHGVSKEKLGKFISKNISEKEEFYSFKKHIFEFAEKAIQEYPPTIKIFNNHKWQNIQILAVAENFPRNTPLLVPEGFAKVLDEGVYKEFPIIENYKIENLDIEFCKHLDLEISKLLKKHGIRKYSNFPGNKSCTLNLVFQSDENKSWNAKQWQDTILYKFDEVNPSIEKNGKENLEEYDGWKSYDHVWIYTDNYKQVIPFVLAFNEYYDGRKYWIKYWEEDKIDDALKHERFIERLGSVVGFGLIFLICATIYNIFENSAKWRVPEFGVLRAFGSSKNLIKGIFIIQACLLWAPSALIAGLINLKFINPYVLNLLVSDLLSPRTGAERNNIIELIEKGSVVSLSHLPLLSNISNSNLIFFGIASLALVLCIVFTLIAVKCVMSESIAEAITEK
jgi:ABC-type lipoprotein export system ATPase subunit